MTTDTTSPTFISEDAVRTIRLELEGLWEKFIRRSASEEDINKHILISIVRIVSSIFNMRKTDIEQNNILKRLCRKAGDPIYFISKQKISKDTTQDDLKQKAKLILPELIGMIGSVLDERVEMIKMKFLRIFPNFQQEYLKQQIIPDLPDPFEKPTEDMFSTHLPFELEQIVDQEKIRKNFQSAKNYLMQMFYDYKKIITYLIASMNWMVAALDIKKTTMFNL
jgi:hypothetical protein